MIDTHEFLHPEWKRVNGGREMRHLEAFRRISTGKGITHTPPIKPVFPARAPLRFAHVRWPADSGRQIVNLVKGSVLTIVKGSVLTIDTALGPQKACPNPR